MKPAAIALAACLAALPAAGQTNRIDLIRPDAPELAAPGPHPVGVRTLTLVNPDQIDVVAVTDQAIPRRDRRLTVEIWYPAAEPGSPTLYEGVLLRDGHGRVTLHGRAVRDAPALTGTPWPVVILSHGYPGNRFLMSHLGENLASKGYVVAAIDHPDSTYDDRGAFGSTLVNRPLDTRFVLEELARLGAGDGPLAGIIDADRAAIIGYSMGGYGAVISAGAGVSARAVDLPFSAPRGLLAIHRAGSETHRALMDPRLRAFVAIGPWGRQYGFWDAEGVAGIDRPILYVGGSVDDVSDYARGIRVLWQETTGAPAWLLTFHNANHNAAAPIPAPAEAWQPSPHLDFVPFEHYADPVWDTVRMNNILQHFVTAFLGWQLKGETALAAYLDLIPNAGDGVHALNEDGSPKPEHSYWKGFAPRTAVGLSLEFNGVR
ncbi:MAG: dienelactone hydrolase [Alphaproteobacteria bacterium]|nr:MAG: dienelactone hydrolase [Alphaproteobacteria bacterium]